MMYLYKITFLLSLFSCGNLILNAQNSSSQQLPKVISPSPNVAALQRYGDIPISPYTGIPNISIPLYEIKAGDLSIPISISYHASGIKVSDEASRVGLGWSLNAGGVISRTIIGEDDFVSSTFGYHATTTISDLPKGPPGQMGSNFNIQDGPNTSVGGIANLPALLNNGYNFQPDLYSFNFLDYSGKFYLKRNREVILNKKIKINIQCVDVNANSWQVITDNGTKYFFEQYETYTETESSTGGGSNTAKTAWYLTKIISSTGKTVTFQYITTSNFIRPTGSFFESKNPSVYTTTGSAAAIAPAFPIIAKSSPGKDYKNLYLDKILFDQGEVKFNYSTRTDIANDVKLDEIIISSKDNTGTLKVLKKLSFGYEYFSGTVGNSYVSGTGLQTSQRLKLKTLTEKNFNNEVIPPYEFSYNNEYSSSGSLPSKVAFSRDHWGYYNGKNNTSLVPVYSGSNSSNITVFSIGIQGTQRDTEPTTALLFSLNQIKYPTGGKTVFEFESHDFDIDKSIINDHSFFNVTPEIVSKSINKLYIPPFTGELPTASDLPNKLLDMTDMFLEQYATTARVDLTGFFRYSATQASCNFTPGTVYLTLARENGTVISSTDLATFLGATTQPMSSCAGPPTSVIGIQFKNFYNLTPGKYVWKLNFNSPTVQIADVSLTVSYNVPQTNQPILSSGDIVTNGDFAGGLRVKRIYDYQSDQAIPNVKRYYYHYADTSGNIYTYGRRMSRPVYTYFDESFSSTTDQSGNTYWGRFQHLIRESDSNVPLNGSAGGSVVGYDNVTIFHGDNGENGKTEYAFENAPDLIWNYAQNDALSGVSAVVPRKPPTLPSVPNEANGNILKQTQFENRNGIYIKVSELINSYTELFTPQTVVTSYGLEKRNYNNPQTGTTYAFKTYVYPTLVESRKLLTSTIANKYDKYDPLKFVSQQTDYTYNNTTHLQLSRTTTKNSTGNNVITDMTYPLDYSDADSDASIIEMKGVRFMHSIPITKRVTLNKISDNSNLIITGDISKFQIQNGLILLKEVAKLDINKGVSSIPSYQPSGATYPTGFNPLLKFNLYDIKGNILEQQKTDDIKQSFIWDYFSEYPIAEVVNANVSEIAYTSFEAEGKGNWNNYSGIITTLATAPTGQKYYNLTTTSTLSKTAIIGSINIISYWRNSAIPYSISGGTSVTATGKTINGWTYFEHKVTTSATTLTITGTGGIDEVRFYPEKAQMTTYTYIPLVGMSSQSDANNKITYYEYDAFGRLLRIKDANNKILKQYDYKYLVPAQ